MKQLQVALLSIVAALSFGYAVTYEPNFNTIVFEELNKLEAAPDHKLRLNGPSCHATNPVWDVRCYSA